MLNNICEGKGKHLEIKKTKIKNKEKTLRPKRELNYEK